MGSTSLVPHLGSSSTTATQDEVVIPLGKLLTYDSDCCLHCRRLNSPVVTIVIQAGGTCLVCRNGQKFGWSSLAGSWSESCKAPLKRLWLRCIKFTNFNLSFVKYNVISGLKTGRYITAFVDNRHIKSFNAAIFISSTSHQDVTVIL